MKLILFIVLLVSGLPAYSQYKFNYTLARPDQLDTLPPILTEISGLTDADDHHIACVQDELGIIFFYNLNTRTIDREISFDEPGDYEGLTRVGNSWYILRSDGRLSFVDEKKKVSSVQLPLITANNEGLCYDPFQKRLLLAAKSKPINHDLSNKRLIYAYDLTTGNLSEKPAYSLDLQVMTAMLDQFKIGHLKSQTTPGGKQKPFNFRPSSLAVHPVSKHIYIISAMDKLLVVIDRKGKILDMRSLEHEIFTKPEGITFFSNGDMVITNEAAGRQPSLILYRYRK